MGKPCFLKITKFFATFLLGAAAAIAAIAVLSSPAAALGGDGGNGDTTKSWDTDNLRYASGRYNARSFNIPFHNYDSYSGVSACQSGVADAFFQAGGSVGAVNDFPYLDWVSDADGNESWAVQESGVRSDGCDEFVAQQDEMAAQIVGNGGYYLDSSGKLQKLDSVQARFSGRSLVYGDWDRKGSGFAINSGTGEVVSGSGYLGRVDGYKKSRAIYPYHARWTVPEGTRDGRFGGQKSWHGTAYERSSGDIVRVARPAGGVVSGGYLPNVPGLCPARFHPRGEDSVERIGSHTGRTLTGLTHARGKVADRYWCRSDLRFARAFETQNHGVALHPAAAGMTGAFQSYGRLNCYYTAFSVSSHASYTKGIRPASSGGLVCSYLFPIPQCDPDTDNGSDSDWRDYTAEELKDIADDLGSSEFDKDEGEACPPEPAPDPQDPTPRNAAGFSDTACVTATLSIYENRVSGADAAPGVIAADQTLAVAAGRTAWDLDITSPYHATASPPRRNGDATGCADGSEDRTFHSTLAGHAYRKQSPAPSYASSARTDSAAPPNDADGDIDYSGAVKNMAHRYASKVAENTCAAKEAEAELVLALGKARADMFSRAASGSDIGGYAARYAAAVESNRKLFSNASPKGYKERLEAVVADASVHRGYWLSWFNTNKAALISRATGKKTAGENFKSVLDTARANYKSTADAVALRSFSSGSCVAHWNSEIARIAGAFSSADAAFASSIATAKNAYHTSYDSYVQATFSATTAGPTSSESVSRSNPFFITAISITGYYCKQGEGSLDGSRCQRPPTTERVQQPYTYYPRQGCIDFVNESEGITPAQRAEFIRQCQNHPISATGYRYVTVTTTYPSTAAHRNYSRTAAQTVIYTTTGRYNGATNPVSSRCSALISKSWTSEQSEPDWPDGHCTPPKSQTARYYDAVGASPALPSAPTRLAVASYPSAPVAVPAHKAALLGKYNPANAARNNLNSSTASARDTAADNLGTLTSATSGAVSKTSFAASAVSTTYGLAASRTSVETEAGDYKTAYTGAYNNAYSQATTDMGTTATTSTWNRFDWRYQTSTLAWGSYQEDPATAYSGWVAQAGETEADRDGTGCDLINVAADGTVSVEATRLDYETSKYGKGSVYGTRTDAQRTCKIRRTRTPELLLEYQPTALLGTDTSKAAAFWHVNYQPTVAAERFKLYDEAEVFAVKASLADRAPVLCYQPGEALVANVGAKGIDAVHKAVFNGASGFAGGIKKHCYKHPSATTLTPAGKTQPQPAFAFFDDTAHSAMDSVSVVWQQPNPKIVSKLGSTDDLKMMANSVALVANTVAYADATRTSSFYGTYYTFPTDSSTESPSGWDISGHPTLTLTSTFRQHVAQAKDAAAKTPTTHTMVFKFVDCVFGIEDVAFVDNIASPYALLSKDGVVPSGWKQTYDSDPHSSPTWYYPAFSTYEGALRLDGRQDSNGNPITYGRNTQGGFAHPSYTLENTAADGMGWGIVYEDKVGKQQPVWAIYAPPVPGDKTLLALEVCGTGNLGAGGANPVATTGTPAARRIGTPATPPPASGVWSWKTSVWNYQDNPVMLWSADDDPGRDDPWETRTSDSSLSLPRKPHNNLEFATEDSDVAALDVFQDASNAAPAGQSRLEDQDMVLANFQPLAVSKSARAQLGGYSLLARSQSFIVPARPSSSILTP